MAQRFDENRDLVQIQLGELENQMRELLIAMQQRDQRIGELEAHAAHQQIEAGNLAAGQQQNPVENALRALQTPQIIRILPPFDGNPIKLHSFIRSIDDLMPEIERVRGTPAYTVWLLAIRSKIIGDADSVLEFYGTSTDWDEIKTNLVTHYSDKRDEVSLTKDLFKLSQKDKNIEDFYKEIQFSLSLMVNQLNLNEPNRDVRSAKTQFYQDMGLKVFLAGLNEPIGQVIRAQCPTSLKDALRRCLEERNFHYQKPKSNPPPVPSRNKFQTTNNNNPFSYGHASRSNAIPRIPFQPNYQQMNPFQYIPPFAHPNNFHPAQQPFQQIPPQRALPPAQPNNFPRAQQPPSQNPFQRNPPSAQPNNSNRQQAPVANSGAHRLPRPIPMEVDHSIRSRQMNYMNRPHLHEMHWTEPMYHYNGFYDPYYYHYDNTHCESDQNDQNDKAEETADADTDNLNFQTDSEETTNT